MNEKLYVLFFTEYERENDDYAIFTDKDKAFEKYNNIKSKVEKRIKETTATSYVYKEVLRKNNGNKIVKVRDNKDHITSYNISNGCKRIVERGKGCFEVEHLHESYGGCFSWDFLYGYSVDEVESGKWINGRLLDE